MSAILASYIYEDVSSSIRLVPYWRTEECFQRIKQTVEEVSGAKSIVYVDCSPDLKSEVNYLLSILPNTDVKVYDHHPLNEASPIKNLMGKSNFDFIFDSDKCVANTMYTLLSPCQKAELGIEDLIKLIQFSEYEGMNFELAGKDSCEKVTNVAFEMAKKRNQKVSANLDKILDIEMSLYYILDQILTDEKEWSFFNDRSISSDQLMHQFEKVSQGYIQRTKSIISGDESSAFSERTTTEFLETLQKLPELLKSGTIIKGEKVGGVDCVILAINVNIFDYGRGLESYVIKELQRRGAMYAILMNKPTRNDDKLSYYFSLRRVNGEYNARYLAEFIKELTGTKIGGGHAWASGVTLNEEQYEPKFDTAGLTSIHTNNIFIWSFK